MSLIKGDTGWIVIDPMITVETARAAMSLVNRTLGHYPVKAVIYSHPHADHYQGVKGVITDEEVAAGDVEIIAPVGFMEHAVSENVYAGTAMQTAGYVHVRNFAFLVMRKVLSITVLASIPHLGGHLLLHPRLILTGPARH